METTLLFLVVWTGISVHVKQRMCSRLPSVLSLPVLNHMSDQLLHLSNIEQNRMLGLSLHSHDSGAEIPCDTELCTFHQRGIDILAVCTQQEMSRLLRPNTLRALYGKDQVKNAVHCTDLPEDGVLEVRALPMCSSSKLS